MKVLFYLALVFGVSASLDQGVNRPVNKVIQLLRDMLAQLDKEQGEDEATYNKLACWCETNEKDKTRAIDGANAKIREIETSLGGVEVGAPSPAEVRLRKEIEALRKDIQANQQALARAQHIRNREHDEFEGENKDLSNAIASLKAAIVVLSKHHAPPAEALMHISSVIKLQMQKHADMLQGVIKPHWGRTITSFMQGFFGQAPTFKQAYSAGSGEIYGILQQMLETFESNLGAAGKEEADAQSSFEDLKKAKEDQIDAAEDELDNKQDQLAEVGEHDAQAWQDLEDTKATLAADEEYLADLKEKCTMTDSEWEDRQSKRQAEMKAVSEALAILTQDDAHDNFVRTFNPSLQQKTVVPGSARRNRVVAVLRAAAKITDGERLLQLAQSVQLDSFTRVKSAIDKMVSQLLKEQSDEQKHRDFCVEERNQNERQTAQKDQEKTVLSETVEQKTRDIAKLSDDIAALKRDTLDAQVEIKRAGQAREAENKDFQMTVSDQRETRAILKKALDVLAHEYGQTALMQQGPPPPADFKKYEKVAAGGVMSLLQQIIEDTTAMEKATVQAERDAQGAYEKFVKDTNDVVSSYQKSIVDKSEDKAKAEDDKNTASQDLASVVDQLEELATYSANLHQSCDFIVKNFDVRQTSRSQEIEALRQAKAILSGSAFAGSSLLRRF